MPISPVQTESLCPHCLRRIPARRVHLDDSVYLEKVCPEHGELEPVLLWRNDPWAYERWNRSSVLETPAPFIESACPDRCGICPDHRQATCTAILEVTHRCDHACPVCFAASGKETRQDPGLNEIRRMLETAARSGPCPVQLSGGEPTLRDDLPQIVALARECGFDHIQVNTNGIRLALDPEYGKALKDAGITDFFLQFDGLTDGVYERIRGATLLQLKLKAIERCVDLNVAVILVPTLVRGVNEDQVGPLIRFAKEKIPTVKGVHFQPMTWLGRYPESPRNTDRILIPEILSAIEAQTEGELAVENMIPSG
jgi:7,8-dihydro-6-hydroxymethylpterin dimethyltransferase